jgi:hypothetical protein
MFYRQLCRALVSGTKESRGAMARGDPASGGAGIEDGGYLALDSTVATDERAPTFSESCDQ